MRLTLCSQPIHQVPILQNHPQQIIDLQQQITDPQAKQFLPPECNYTNFAQRIQTLTNARHEARNRPAPSETDEELLQESAEMMQDAQQSGEEVSSLRTQ